MAWAPVQEPLTENSLAPASSFALSNDPIDNTFLLIINGSTQNPATDYTLSGSNVFTTSLIPSGWNVYASYIYNNTTDLNTGDVGTTCEEHERVTPAGIRASTTLSTVITSYELLAERIKMQIGWPMTNIELCDDQIYDFINQGCEWYSKYAGLTEDYLMFDSKHYVCGYGIRIDRILNHIADFYCGSCGDTATSIVSGQYIDCDTNNYRKVAGIFSMDPAGGQGYSSEILFNMDYMFAQQAYFGAMMGGFGYDVTTWHLLKSWMDLRKKMFASDTYVQFNPTTQLLKLIPEPQVNTGGRGYVGVIGVKMEKSIAELVQERWVQRYALALTKIALAHIRGKFGGVTLFGGGQVNPSDLMTQGLQEKDEMEKELMNGYGEAEPPLFYCA
jgi:hypothetical protein